MKSIIQSLRGQSSASKQVHPKASALPPPYEQDPQPKLKSRTRLAELLKPKSQPVPQWNWTNSQCRIWLADICENFLEFSPEEAQDIAHRFEGYGPTIFAMELKDWQAMLGISPGIGVHAMVQSSWNKKGAAPAGFDTKKLGAPEPREKFYWLRYFL